MIIFVEQQDTIYIFNNLFIYQLTDVISRFPQRPGRHLAMQYLRCNISVIRGDLSPSHTTVAAGCPDESQIFSAEGLYALNNRAIIQLRHKAASRLKLINVFAIFAQSTFVTQQVNSTLKRVRQESESVQQSDLQ